MTGRASANRRRLLPSLGNRLAAYSQQHLDSLVASLLKLYFAPLASGLTITTIGVALALPTSLFLLLNNAERLVGGWERTPQISVFLEPELPPRDQADLAQRVRQWPQVGQVETISKQQALAEFRAYSGLGDALDALSTNPLPPVLVVTPRPGASEAELRQLTRRLERLPASARVSLDMEWLRRLQALTDLLRRSVWLIAVLLALTAILVVGNTIRLDVENRRAEITVGKLIGATDAFIRRPFLYSGAWYGLLGGLLAGIIVTFGASALQAPIEALNRAYGIQFQLQGPGLPGVLTVLAVGFGLGLSGAWLAVGYALRQAEPQ